MNPRYASLLFELRKLHDAARDAYIEATYTRQGQEFREWLLGVGRRVGEHIGRIEEES